MSDWLKKQQRKKIPYGFFKTALDSRKEVSVGGLRRIDLAHRKLIQLEKQGCLQGLFSPLSVPTGVLRLLLP